LDWAPDGRTIYYGLVPGSPSAEAPHVLKTVSVASGRAATVRAAGEFLGLSPDGTLVLQRPGSETDGQDNLVEVVSLDDGSVTRVRLPAGVRSMVWSARSDAIILVAPAGNLDGIWEIPVETSPP